MRSSAPAIASRFVSSRSILDKNQIAAVDALTKNPPFKRNTSLNVGLNQRTEPRARTAAKCEWPENRGKQPKPQPVFNNAFAGLASLKGSLKK